LLEHMPQRNQFCEFLTDRRMKLTSDPLKNVETVFSGGASNPDGAVTFEDVDGNDWKVYLENKTWRRSLDRRQLQNHLKLYCKNNTRSVLLVITPRTSDREVIESLSRQVLFKTWGEICSKLIEINRGLEESSFIISQFIEYGQQRGEFMNMDIGRDELDAYVRTISSNVRGKIAKLFEATFTDFDFAKFGIKRESSEISDHWGRHGAEINFIHRKEYEQWMFFGIYYDAVNHMIPFKQPQTPELAFFLDMNTNKRETLKSV
jgi:hypothetical protein